MRAVLLSALMLSSLELYIEACAQLLRLTSFVSSFHFFPGIAESGLLFFPFFDVFEIL